MPTTTALRLEAVLFDCDGVLVDSEPLTNAVLRTMLHELGWTMTPEECLRRFVGRAIRDEWPLIEARTGARWSEAWLTEFRRRRDEVLRAGLEPIAGVHQAVVAVSELVGERFACVSGADRAKVELQLRAIGLDDLFGDRVFSGMEVPRTKPAPDVYLAAMTTLGVDPGTVAVVEDSVAGVTAGVAAGATVFGFAPGRSTHTAPEALLAAGAVTTFSAMADLPALLAAADSRPRSRGTGA